MQEFLLPAADLPDSLIRSPPILAQPIEEPVHVLPLLVRAGATIVVSGVNGVHHFAINVELQLVVSAIADAHGTRVLVAAQVIERDLLQVLPAIDAVHYLQRPSLSIVT